MVPKKGLEPPHPCEYMDLNHARLPIPPLRHLECTAYKQSSANERNDIIILPKIRQLTGSFSTALYRQQPMRQGQPRLQGQPVKTPLVSLRGSGPRETISKKMVDECER